ncbi:MAG: preprotein translocase subunit SecE [Solirubrobacteraceae bacterium]
MARNRKRAKERRSRRPTAGQVSRPGVATARAERERDVERERDIERDGLKEAPSPIEHATPDVELADAQLAVGRPEMAAAPEPDEPEPDELESDEPESDGLEPDDEDDFADDVGATGGYDGGAGSGGGELAASSAPAPARRKLSGNRLITFLQGSWRELQRVQWPDRQQVMQATGVVIGFVIVAGVFLGVADTIAGKVVTLILK